MKPSVEQVVQNQLEAYNERDLERFVTYYSPEITFHDLPSGELVVSGLEQMRKRYAVRFANPDLHCFIANRMVIGDFVIDSEEIVGILETGIYRVIVIYEVKEGLINRIWMMR